MSYITCDPESTPESFQRSPRIDNLCYSLLTFLVMQGYTRSQTLDLPGREVLSSQVVLLWENQVKGLSCEQERDMKRFAFLGCLLSSALCLSFPATAGAYLFPWEHVTGYMSSPPYGWTYSYDIGFYSDILMIDVDVRLTGYAPDPSLRNRWENGIESIWSTNRFSVPISFNVDWVTTDYDQSVTVVGGTGRWNMTTWYTVGAGGWGDAYQEEVAAHEYGHMVSMWDEYAGGAVNPATNLINTGGLMHTLDGPTLDYYYDPFLSWYEEKLAAVPVPGAALLGVIGLAYSGWRLRRRTA